MRPLDVHVDHTVPFVDLEPLKWRLRHQLGVVDHHDPPVSLHGCANQSFHLIGVDDVGSYGECLAAATTQLVGLGLYAISAPCAQHDGRALCGEPAGGRFTQPAPRTRDDHDFSYS
jgi:hypothetical protein